MGRVMWAARSGHDTSSYCGRGARGHEGTVVAVSWDKRVAMRVLCVGAALDECGRWWRAWWPPLASGTLSERGRKGLRDGRAESAAFEDPAGPRLPTVRCLSRARAAARRLARSTVGSGRGRVRPDARICRRCGEEETNTMLNMMAACPIATCRHATCGVGWPGWAGSGTCDRAGVAHLRNAHAVHALAAGHRFGARQAARAPLRCGDGSASPGSV